MKTSTPRGKEKTNPNKADLRNLSLKTSPIKNIPEIFEASKISDGTIKIINGLVDKIF
jgi:hypothetical protein